jgi:serine/threonine protein kinase
VVPTDLNRLQGRIILAQGWLSKDVIVKALQRVGRDTDLCTLLVAHGALSRSRADRVRHEINRHRGHQTRIQTQVDPSERKRRTTTNTAMVAPAQPLKRRSRQTEAIRNFVTDSSLFKQAIFNNKSPSVKGKRFIHFEIVGEVNRGAMGVVYRAKDLTTEKMVAIKFMLANNPGQDEQIRFKREVGVLARLDHPNIVKVVHYGCEAGLLFFAMELIEGENLKDYVDNILRTTGRPPSWTQIARLIKPIANAIHYCHETGIVHRDIKPQNIIVEEKTQRAVLIDFGLIKKDRNKVDESFLSGGLSLTQHGEMVGTPAFMSPEQFAPGGNFGEIGPCSDVWGLGATCFYALSGVPPYNFPSAIEIFRSIMTYDAPGLAQLNPNLPNWLHQLVDACLLRQSMFRPRMTEIASGMEKGIAPQVDSASRSDSRSGSHSYTRNRSRTPSKKILALFGSAILSLFVFIVSIPFFLSTEERSMRFESLKVDLLWTKKSRTQIFGKVNQSEALVSIGGKMIFCDDQGVFSSEVDLSVGKNMIEVEILEGPKKIVKTVTIYRDVEPPIIDIEGDIKNDTLVLKRLVLKGRVRDAMPAQIALLDETVALREDGQFVLSVPESDSALFVTLKALDQAGNLGERRITLLTPKARKKRQQKLFLLSDYEIWSRASAESQDLAIIEIASQLGPKFRKLPAKTYQCNKLKFRIGRFRHEQTGIKFHLIPGGSFQIGSLLSDDEREVAKELDEKLDVYRKSVASLRQQLSYSEAFNHYKRVLKKSPKATLSQRIKQLQDLATDLPPALDFLRSATNSSASSNATEIFAIIKMRPVIIDHFNENLSFVGQFYTNAEYADSEKLQESLKTSIHNTLRLQQIQGKLQEQPSSRTRVEKFLVSQTEVSWQQWNKIQERSIPKVKLKQPAVGLTWNEVQNWLGKVGNGFRLPSESEWEYACRAASNNNYFWGPTFDKEYSWVKETAQGRLHNVQDHQNRGNAFGLLDMLGNAQEWTAEIWVDRYDKPRPMASREKRRVARGGHIRLSYMLCRSATRLGFKHDEKNAEMGFRVFLTIPK